MAALRTQAAALVATLLEHHASLELLLDGCLGADRIALTGGHAAWFGGIGTGFLTSEQSKELILSSCSSLEALNLDLLGRRLRNLLSSLGFLLFLAGWLLSVIVFALSLSISFGLGAGCFLFDGVALLRLGLGLLLLIFLLLLAAVLLPSSLSSAVGLALRGSRGRFSSVFHDGINVLGILEIGIVVMREVGRELAVTILGNFLQEKSTTCAEPYTHWGGNFVP